MTWVRTKTPEKENKTEGNGMCQARTREQEGEFSVSGQSTVKSPTQELSGFELSKMWTFVPMSNHINEFTCPAYTVTCQVCAFSTSGGGFVLYYTALCRLGFPGGSVVKKKKNLPANAGDVVSIPDWEDPLEEETATHSSILAWEIPWTEEPARLQSMRSQRVRHGWATKQQQLCRVQLV